MNKNTFIKQLAPEKDCPICGKRFCYTSEWAWNYREMMVCSYKCMRTMEKSDPVIMETEALISALRNGIDLP